MKIKKGDKVQVIAGKDKGTVGEVMAVFPKVNKVIVEGVAVAKKSLKPSQANPDGGIVDKEMPIDASNVKKVDSKAKSKKADKKPAKKVEKAKEEKKPAAKKAEKKPAEKKAEKKPAAKKTEKKAEKKPAAKKTAKKEAKGGKK